VYDGEVKFIDSGRNGGFTLNNTEIQFWWLENFFSHWQLTLSIAAFRLTEISLLFLTRV
jgi:hypothetical protein